MTALTAKWFAMLSIRVALIFIVSTAFLIQAFSPTLTEGMMLSNSDSLFFYSSHIASLNFGSLFDLQTFAFGQGFGSFQHATLHHPFWWIFDGTQSVVLRTTPPSRQCF